MKKSCFLVLITIVTMFVGLNGLTLAQDGSAYVSVPGNTLVQDWEDDFLLEKCNISFPDRPCSLPPNSTLVLPAWLDIKKAKITQIGRGFVDLSISVYDFIHEMPLAPFLSYYWQFQDGCLEPSPTDKDAIVVHWDGNTDTWSANWVVITSCDPRANEMGDPVDFQFTEDGVKVRVSLNDLITEIGPSLRWFAGVRRLPFIHGVFSRTLPVDVAPDVIEFDYTTTPPSIIKPEDSATWDMR
jgi:hypothetical protein